MNMPVRKFLLRLLPLALLLPLAAGCLRFHKAAGRGDIAAVDKHLQAGRPVDARDPYGRTPLMWTTGGLDMARHLVERGADVNARDANGETPLMKAAFVGQLDVVKLLVEHGADVNARNQRGETPLMLAFRDLDIVKFLVEHGADVNAADASGETVLLKVAVSGKLNIVRYLLDQGANVDSGARPPARP